MVASVRPEVGGKLVCWNFFAKSPSQLFTGFVIARSRQDAESRAACKAKERQGEVFKLARFSDCLIKTLTANGVMSHEWLTDEEILTVARAYVVETETKVTTGWMKVNRLLSYLRTLDPNPRNQ